MAYWNFPRYVSVAEKQAKAEKKLKQLRKKNPDIRPVCLEGQTLARSWWGKAWNKNLERYADYVNRIGRGRSYVRHGAVLDLQIRSGRVEALVQGTGRQPYKVDIRIEEISTKNWKAMTGACEGWLESLQELLAGQFPKALAEIFTAQGEGLFPTPAEIKFSCSCPDWASMCKHVAATLYGIGARLDEDPSLFFTLRNREISDLVSSAVVEGTKALLDRAEQKSGRVLDDSDLSDVFGIDLDEPAPEPEKAGPKAASTAKKRGSKKAPKTSEPAAAKPAEAKRTAKKATRPAATAKKREKAARKKPGRPPRNIPNRSAAQKPRQAANSAAPEGGAPAIETVAAVIAGHPKGIGVAGIRKATGFDDRKIYNIVHQLKGKGRIRSAGWGKYAPA